MVATTYWRGYKFDTRTAKMLVESEKRSGITIRPTQGSFSSGSKSAGTHSGAGAVDISVRGLNRTQIDHLTRWLRKVGFAAWYRSSSDGFSPHIHGIAIGAYPLPRVAANQVEAFKRGRNGLSDNGRDRQYYLRVAPTTWEAYLRSRVPSNGVKLANVVYKKNNSDVKKVQAAMRTYLWQHGVNPNQYNPGGVTGYYGWETVKLVTTVNWVLYKKSGDEGWRKLDGKSIGSSFAKAIGLTPV